jgi:type III secretory pathway component EscV
MNATTHVKYMVLGAAALLALAVLAGVPLESALPLAILLACPLMMVVMMATMSGGHGHGHGTGADGDAPRETTSGSNPDGSRRR